MDANFRDAVAEFAAEAVRFRDWVRDGRDGGDGAVRQALIRVTALYLAALELPPEWSDKLEDAEDAALPTLEECQAIERSVASRLPFTNYARMYNPFTLPPEEPVVGTIGDDIADIYGDVVSGLVEYESGRRAEAIWVWVFTLRTHWGRHATDAIFALHTWLAENAWDQLHPNPM